MSEADRKKWNARYEEGAYVTRQYPSELLVDRLPGLILPESCGRAIDIACGSGRNSLYLARKGWKVDAVDISDMALEQLDEKARAEGLSITGINRDLEQDPEVATDFLVADTYDLAIMFRYAHSALLEPISRALKPGGYLIVESHLVTEAEVVGPRGTRHRVAPGELRQAADGLDVIVYSEGIVLDPDGRSAAIARLVARRPS